MRFGTSTCSVCRVCRESGSSLAGQEHRGTYARVCALVHLSARLHLCAFKCAYVLARARASACIHALVYT